MKQMFLALPVLVLAAVPAVCPNSVDDTVRVDPDHFQRVGENVGRVPGTVRTKMSAGYLVPYGRF